MTIDRIQYYYTYYDQRKHIYRIQYYEKKAKDKANEELYKPFGGERKYYLDKLVELGCLVIKKC